MTDASTQRPDLTDELTATLQERILVIDGAMGTMIQAHTFDEAGFRGERFADWDSDVRGNSDLLSLSQPDVIRDIHRAYLEAGADISPPTRSAPSASPRPTTAWRTWPTR